MSNPEREREGGREGGREGEMEPSNHEWSGSQCHVHCTSHNDIEGLEPKGDEMDSIGLSTTLQSHTDLAGSMIIQSRW